MRMLSSRNVSIHAPTGGATCTRQTGRNALWSFQFTRPRGARRSPQGFRLHLHGFNSRAHGGRDPAAEVALADIAGFNSRAHGGRDLYRHPPAVRGLVSIHAPTGGATRVLDDGRLVRLVSIHAPTGGATSLAFATAFSAAFQFTRPRRARLAVHVRFDLYVGFNSRAHGGRDSSPRWRLRQPPCFNSRAHGGRDWHNKAGEKELSGFNSRAHGGRDTGSADLICAGSFQFTRPRGARRDLGQRQPALGSFNSRAHGGRDSRRDRRIRRRGGFQFTRPRGARHASAEEEGAEREVSIHAPTGGATLAVEDSSAQVCEVSIHAPTGGATRDPGRAGRAEVVSIHAPTGGATARA